MSSIFLFERGGVYPNLYTGTGLSCTTFNSRFKHICGMVHRKQKAQIRNHIIAFTSRVFPRSPQVLYTA